jgi:LCP family protein required for cell wall assembly
MRRLLGWVVVLGLLGGLVYWLYPLLGSLVRFGALPQPLVQPLTVLVQGVSPEYSGYHTRSPENFRGHADTLILVRFDPVQKRAVALSIPRDTYVNLPGYGYRKINEANYRKGPEFSMEAVSSLVGVSVQAYVSVGTQALKEIIDALGGVEVCIDKPLEYQDTAAKLKINLQPGCQKLDGAQAEGYLRFRKDALGDIGRIQRQQAFFQAMRDQVLTPAGLLSLPRAIGALEASTQTNLTRSQMAQLLGFATTQPALVGLLLPGGFGNGWQVDPYELRNLAAYYFLDQPDATGAAATPAALSGKLVSLVYPPELFDQAAQIRSKVRALGMRVLMREVDAAPARTEVLANSTPGLAQVLAEQLQLPWRISGEITLGADLMVRIGTP